jgi:hypothetical protein
MPVALLGVPMLEQLAGASFTFGARVTLYLGGSIAVGMVMARLVEVPALWLRERWYPSPERERRRPTVDRAADLVSRVSGVVRVLPASGAP